MGGHGGLNILPQKRWNVYNYENREKVRRDEEQAARDEQIKRDEVRKRDAEFRLERLRTAKGLAPLVKAKAEEEKEEEGEEEPESNNSGNNGHINLFEGIKIFDPVRGTEKRKELLGEREGWKKEKRMKKEEGKSSGVAVGPEDDKYRLGYGVAGKGVKMPWYLEKRNGDDEKGGGDDSDGKVKNENNKKKKNGRKTLEELREERLKREKREKERERVLIGEKGRSSSSHSERRSDRDVYGNKKFNRSLDLLCQIWPLGFCSFCSRVIHCKFTNHMQFLATHIKAPTLLNRPCKITCQSLCYYLDSSSVESNCLSEGEKESRITLYFLVWSF